MGKSYIELRRGPFNLKYKVYLNDLKKIHKRSVIKRPPIPNFEDNEKEKEILEYNDTEDEQTE